MLARAGEGSLHVSGTAARPARAWLRRAAWAVAASACVVGAKVAHALYPLVVPLPPTSQSDVFRPTEGVDRLLRDVAVAALMAAEYLYRSPKTDAEWESAHVAAAKRLLKLCQVNRGIYVKLGQHVSQLQHLLPQPYVDTMRAMCSQAPRSATPLVHKVLAEELGGDWAERLCDFEPIPVASASLAQVHRAIDARTGRALAVKVQHSGLRETSAADIVMVSAIIDAAARLFPKFDYTWLAEELALNLPQELDFEREGRNAERTAALFADDDAVVVPRIHWDLSTSRVLTMDFEEGCHVDDVAGITAQGLRTADVARVVSHTFARQIFLEGFVHCDPHAGNMLVRPKRGPDEATADAQLVLLDHGLYRELTDRFRRSYGESPRARRRTLR